MDRLHAVITVISLWMARVGGLMLVGSAVVITMEILAREVIHIPFSVTGHTHRRRALPRHR